MLSLMGGVAGILVGVAMPLSGEFSPRAFRYPFQLRPSWLRLPCPVWWALVFGLLPANRAARLNPTELFGTSSAEAYHA